MNTTFKFKAIIFKSKIISNTKVVILSIIFVIIPSFWVMNSYIIPFVNKVTIHYSLNSINSRYLFRFLTTLEIVGFVLIPLYILFKIHLKKLIAIIDNNKISIKSGDKYILNTNINQIESVYFREFGNSLNTRNEIKFITASKVMFLQSFRRDDKVKLEEFSKELKKRLLLNNYIITEKHQEQTFFKVKSETQFFSKK